MRIRRLERSEHKQTRWLYEQVFAEDSREFVDYYYTWKTKDSIIYVAEDENGFHAMVHLNPFLVSVSGKVQKLHYIVAVATQKEYRHQGLMRRLLELAEREMVQRGELFTFLMPASEKIYLPFGYRFFAWQRKGVLRADSMAGVSGAPGKSEDRLILAAEVQSGFATDAIKREAVPSVVCGAVCRPVRLQEYGKLAAFVNDTLSRQYDVFIFRDAAYYERLCAEQKCQGGEVMVIVQAGQEPERSDEKACAKSGRSGEKSCAEPERPDTKMGRKKGRIIGTFCTAREEADSEYAMEIREVIFAEEMQTEALDALREFVNGGCRVAGCQAPIALEQETFEPLLMGKVPGGGEFAGLWDRKRVFINEVV